MENEMIERVAQAISNAKGMPYIGNIEPFRAAARAAIEAMREPTGPMLIAGQMAQAASIEKAHVEGRSINLMHKLAAVEPGHLEAAHGAMIATALA